MSRKPQITPILAFAGLALAMLAITSQTHAAALTFGSRTLVSTNNANFDISVFDGNAKYNDRGVGGSQPGAPTFQTILGDGTVLDYNFVGNANNGAGPLTTYASGAAGRIPTPTSAAANTHGSGEDWSNVWTTNDPGANLTFNGSAKNHNPTGVAGAGNTFARSAEVDGTIDISGLESGEIYIPHGSYVNQWDLTLTMTGDGQTDLVATDGTTANIGGNNGWINDFSFDNSDLLYDTIAYNYTNRDRDGSRARFMGVILDGVAPAAAVPEPASIAIWSLLGLCLAGYGYRRRRNS